ncbi:hypothetical protein OG596_14865 [Streptomyces sp. NBC_01102]|uniref:hypothetical protein n=1 Tax=unclassified Streptomyces TaxID=2593676 RepID=UPI00386FF5FA|nr:hypothetical protein OG596_14865 [Streptomyces sp. NBC_01102]
MPTPEREVQPQSPQTDPPPVSAVSMKDLLASCVAATAVSTPPREAREDAEDSAEDDGHSQARDAA